MKKTLNFKNLFILGLIIILSCTEDNPLQPTIDFDYTIELAPSVENQTYYADGCLENCIDPNPIIFIATLNSGNKSINGISQQNITFSYLSTDITEVIQPFDNQTPKTDNSGKTQVSYDDKGFAGDVTIIASFTAPAGFGDSTITSEYSFSINPYYELIDPEKLSIYTSNGADNVIAGAGGGVDIKFKVTDLNNYPLPNIPVIFSKNIDDGTLSPSIIQRTDINGEATSTIYFPNEDTDDDEVSITATIMDPNIPNEISDSYKSTKSLGIQPPTTPNYSLTLNLVSIPTPLFDDDGTILQTSDDTSIAADSLGYYSDGDFKNITYQVILRNHQDAAFNKQIQFSWQSVDENNNITEAYFENHQDYNSGDFTDGAGILKKHLNDGGQNGVLLVTASLIENGIVQASDTNHVKIELYEKAVGNIIGYSEKDIVYSGVNAATLDSVRVVARVQDHTDAALANVDIQFGFGDSDGAQFGAFKDGISTVKSNELGEAYVTYKAFPNTSGSDDITIVANLLNGEADDPTDSIHIDVKRPLFDYCLYISNDGTTNYSDFNLTKTRYDVTLLNVSCEGVNGDCCSNQTVIDQGVGMQAVSTNLIDDNDWLSISFDNTSEPVPSGEIVYEEGTSTDDYGNISFVFYDNGESGTINLNIEFTDKYGNSTAPLTDTLTIYPIEQTVENVQLTSLVTQVTILETDSTDYETEFDVKITDDLGTGIENVNVEFYKNWELDGINQGLLTSSNCLTSTTGECVVSLSSTRYELGTADVYACVEFNELERVFRESNAELQFSWIEKNPSIISSKSKSKSKGRKTKRDKRYSLKIEEFKNTETYQTQSGDNLFCKNGISDSHSVLFITEQQVAINEVKSVDVWVDVGQVVEDNINVTVVDTIFARALNSSGQGISNVPVQFTKTTTGFGYISSDESITDSTGLAMTIYYPNTESYTGSENSVNINFTIGVAGNDELADVNLPITIDMSGNINVEYDVAYFDFYPNVDNISHIMGNETSIEVIAKNEDGVAIANVPIRFSLSSATLPCQGSSECEAINNSTDCEAVSPFCSDGESLTELPCINNGGIWGGCEWDLISPSGILSNFLVDTCCQDENDETDSSSTDDSTAVTQAGVARVSYINSEGLSDKLRAYILDPLNANQILFEDELTITTNITTGLITWAQLSTVSVASLDSLYCDSLYVTAIDANGNTLADIPVTFNLDDDVSGSISIINSETGENGSPASALFCPVQGFIGYCDEVTGNDGCHTYETIDGCSDDIGSYGDCYWEDEVNIEISTTVANVDNSTISITYLDATPECPECIAELKLEANDFILPSEATGECTGNTGCEAMNNSTLCDALPTFCSDVSYLSETECTNAGETWAACSWVGSRSTYIVATLIDSLGYGPADNTHIFYEAIQQVPETDNPENLVWEPVGSIPEIDYFSNDTSQVLFSMENASGLIAIVGNSMALTDTIFLQLKSTTPSYIEIFDPYPSDIMVQGGGGQASTDLNIAIRDANGSNVDKPFWVNFNIVGAPAGVHINGENDVLSVDQLTLNGESSISINAGTTPGTVRIKVELYEDNNGTIGDVVSEVPTEEKNVVTVITGPAAQGYINYSYVDLEAIGGGVYEVPVTAMLLDVHSNPVNDSTSVYFDVRGITDQYDATKDYYAGDIVYWGSAPSERNETPDSLVYKCYNPIHGVCQLSEIGAVPNVPDNLVNNPPDNDLEIGVCNALDVADNATCNDNLSSSDCIAENLASGECTNIGAQTGCGNAPTEDFCDTIINDNGMNCEWVPNDICSWENTFDVNTAGQLWIPQNHPATIEGGAKTGNENADGESFTGIANTMLRYGTSEIFGETVIRAHTLGANGETLIIDSRASHAGSNLVLPFPEDGTLSLSPAPSPGAWDFSIFGTPAEVTVTASITDFYQYAVDDGELVLNVDGATIISSCNGMDQDGDGTTGICFEDIDGNGVFDDSEELLPFNSCFRCGDEGGFWQFSDKDLGESLTTLQCDNAAALAGITDYIWYGDAYDGAPNNGRGWCGDTIQDDNPGFGLTDPNGQVVWVIRYPHTVVGPCDPCDGTVDAPACENFESNISVSLRDPILTNSDPAVVLLSRSDHCADGLP